MYIHIFAVLFNNLKLEIMKTLKLTLSLVIATLLSVTAMAGKKGIQPLTFKVNTAKSNLVWLGKKVTGEHSGNINLANGALQFEGEKLTGGTFEIDMQTITNTDLTDKGYSDKLVGHLKSADFFGVDKFPKANFELTSATTKDGKNYDVKGKLTIKGITNEVSFPAVVQLVKGISVAASAKITVDRTKFDIKYGSGSFFDNLGDKAIDNNFDLNVTLIAVK
jgi:polyisoprenoid-binding protein YceI